MPDAGGQLALSLPHRISRRARGRLDRRRADKPRTAWRTTPRDDIMAGLAMGIVVAAGAGRGRARRAGGRARRLHSSSEASPEGPRPSGLGFVLQRGARGPAADSVGARSSLARADAGGTDRHRGGEPLPEPAAVHWHGIELESYSDGVAGWSGAEHHVAPSIAPGDSFVARLTLPRAGTFIYHTHMNDVEQLTSGSTGGSWCSKPGRRFDPRRDHIYVAGWDSGENPHLLVNGDSLPKLLHLAAGVRHRLPVRQHRGRGAVAVRGLPRHHAGGVAETGPGRRRAAARPGAQGAIGRGAGCGRDAGCRVRCPRPGLSAGGRRSEEAGVGADPGGAVNSPSHPSRQ